MVEPPDNGRWFSAFFLIFFAFFIMGPPGRMEAYFAFVALHVPSHLLSGNKARHHSTVALPLCVRSRMQHSMEATALSFEVELPT